MSEQTIAPSHASELPWWLQPAATVTVLTVFGIYSIWTALQGHGYAAPYLSPFYSPPIRIGAIPISSAFWVLWVPLGFRATCYYYRKAYYRSYFLDPVSCMIPERRSGYAGETRFPFVANNLHRFFLYLAIVVVLFLWKDAVEAFTFNGRFGVHLGSLLFLVNVVLLSGYTFGCHAFRHLSGGNLDCFSCARGGPARHRLRSWVSVLTMRHGQWAWGSMFSVWAADVYVRLLGAGVITDPRIF